MTSRRFGAHVVKRTCELRDAAHGLLQRFGLPSMSTSREYGREMYYLEVLYHS